MPRVSNTDDLIDSRDVIARLETLALLHQPGPVDLESTEGGEPGDNDTDQDELFAEERVLLALASEAADYAPDWEDGATLIHEDYFVTYAQELAEDFGAVNPDIGWPGSYIDWDAAADALKIDYSAVGFDGERYWVR